MEIKKMPERLPNALKYESRGGFAIGFTAAYDTLLV